VLAVAACYTAATSCSIAVIYSIYTKCVYTVSYSARRYSVNGMCSMCKDTVLVTSDSACMLQALCYDQCSETKHKF
jgi:hypothetical protein